MDVHDNQKHCDVDQIILLSSLIYSGLVIIKEYLNRFS